MRRITEFLTHLDLTEEQLPDKDQYFYMTELFNHIYGYQFAIQKKKMTKKGPVFTVLLNHDTYEIASIASYSALFQAQFSFDQVTDQATLLELCWNYVHLKVREGNRNNQAILTTLFPGLEEFYGLFRLIQKTKYRTDPFAQFSMTEISFETINQYLFRLIAEDHQKQIEQEEQRLSHLHLLEEELIKTQEEEMMRRKYLWAEPIYVEGKKEVEFLCQQQDYYHIKIEGLRFTKEEQIELQQVSEAKIMDLSCRNFWIRLWYYRKRKKLEQVVLASIQKVNEIKEEIQSLVESHQEVGTQIKNKIEEIETAMEIDSYELYEEKLSYYQSLLPKDVTKQLSQVKTQILESNLDTLLNALNSLYEKNKQYLNLEATELEKESGYQYQLKENV